MPDRQRLTSGDLILRIVLEVPKKISGEQEESVRELAELEHANVSPHRKSFFEKVKDCPCRQRTSDET